MLFNILRDVCFTDCWFVSLAFLKIKMLYPCLIRLTFKELLELRLVHIVRDVAHEELLGVGVPDHPATLRLSLLALSN